MSKVIGGVKGVLWIGLAVALSGSGSAFAVPEYNIKAYCKQVSEVGGGGSYSIEQSCRGMEAQAKRRVEGMEKAVPARVMTYCDQVSATGGGGSYAILETCIKMEMQAKRRMGD